MACRPVERGILACARRSSRDTRPKKLGLMQPFDLPGAGLISETPCRLPQSATALAFSRHDYFDVDGIAAMPDESWWLLGDVSIALRCRCRVELRL